MVRLTSFTLAWLTAAAIASAQAPSNASVYTLIVECETSQHVELVAQDMQGKGGQVRHKIDSDIFRGISVQMADVAMAEETMAEMKNREGITDVWRAQAVSRAAEEEDGADSVNAGDAHGGHVDKRAADDLWTHMMTSVDKLHSEGFTGNGIKIAVVDSGVDYTHPGLGGCFGKGCRVALGDNFSAEGKRGDPMDCQGHGTGVAGVLAGYSREVGFVGAAPNATLLAYRVLDCKAKGSEDDIIAGWNKAYEDGAQIIVSSTAIAGHDWEQRPLAKVASRIAARGVSCIAAVGNSLNKGLFFTSPPASGSGVIAVNSLTSGSGASRLSAYGPTWNLGIKPNIVAPGDGVWTTQSGGTYRQTSGTSYAAPLVGGIVALVAEARGNFNPALINNVLMSTARPQQNQDAFMTVAQQGGGLVDAWEAAHATTLVEPAGLEFNDTEHRVESIRLSITNTAESDVSYDVSHLAATTLYTLPKDVTKPMLGNLGPAELDLDDRELGGESVPGTADIKLSPSSFTLRPNQSATVSVSAEEPSGLNATRLPLWSGWITVAGSDGRNLTVPYLGLTGSLRSATKLLPTTLQLRNGSPRNKPGSPASIDKLSKIRSGNVFSRLYVLASPHVLMDIVPLDLCPPETQTSPDPSRHCVPGSMIQDSYGLKSVGQVAGFPRHYTSRSYQDLQGEWDGALANGQYAPPGRYKIVARTLAVFGDANNPSDWQVNESPVFSILYYHNYIPLVEKLAAAAASAAEPTKGI
ncbi:hypothetical protein G3M48_006491 [Beauveria asiatica]|uniref:Uncharacterized protein n=1 Tax=Beauveria asiatica TaxID=1069075 RepID=A0AAW0RPV0_9HYPO